MPEKTVQQSPQNKDHAPQKQQAPAVFPSIAQGSAGLLMDLQRTHGNRFVQRLIQRACSCNGSSGGCSADEEREQVQKKDAGLRPFIQTKLTVSQSGDPYEQEADHVADQVMRKIAAPLPAQSMGEGQFTVQRAEDSTTSDEDTTGNPLIDQINSILEQDGVQAKSESDGLKVSEGFESDLSNTKGSGQPIPGSTKAEMESAFGADFSNVRLHTDSNAVRLSRDVSAHAFTHGNDIYFNEGKFNPGNRDGQHLLAHELTHVIQQGGNQIRRLSITRNLRDAGECGAKRVRWTFSLDNPAPANGYIVQRIRNLQTVENCPSNVSSISLTPTMEYWEAWDVSTGDTVDWTTTRDGWTDENARPAEPNKSGTQASLGTVKFFLRSVTGDLGGFGVAPATAGSAWGPGKAPFSGALPSTLSKPSWWDNAPTEGPASRWASAWWNCCGEESSHFSRIDSNP